MVGRWGMSPAIGPIAVLPSDGVSPLLPGAAETSEATQRLIDDEVRRIVESAHQRARTILTDHEQDLRKISEILVKRETIEKEEFLALLDGKDEVEVFGAEEPRAPELPLPPAPADRPGREAPRPLPRPGVAGGTADMRGDIEPPKLA
jgi:cell division protease FtsH